MENRTTIIIAHRLSTLNNVDRILVFDQGKVVEDGTKESLLKAKGHFAMLWEMQSDGFLPDNR
jgi:ATP-binding cassette subfamily B protein